MVHLDETTLINTLDINNANTPIEGHRFTIR